MSRKRAMTLSRIKDYNDAKQFSRQEGITFHEGGTYTVIADPITAKCMTVDRRHMTPITIKGIIRFFITIGFTAFVFIHFVLPLLQV